MLSQKAYSLVAGIFFCLVAVGHLLRIVYAEPVHLADWTVPMWPSWVALVVAGYLGIAGLMLSRK
jgi:hypothetical protein